MVTSIRPGDWQAFVFKLDLLQAIAARAECHGFRVIKVQDMSGSKVTIRVLVFS
jgi:hypothetical protein